MKAQEIINKYLIDLGLTIPADYIGPGQFIDQDRDWKIGVQALRSDILVYCGCNTSNISTTAKIIALLLVDKKKSAVIPNLGVGINTDQTFNNWLTFMIYIPSTEASKDAIEKNIEQLKNLMSKIVDEKASSSRPGENKKIFMIGKP